MRLFQNVEHFLAKATDELGKTPTLRERIYEALGHEEPIRVDDWAGPQPKDKRQILVVALTRTRLVTIATGIPPYYEDDGTPHLNVSDWLLVNTTVQEQWSPDHKQFLLTLLDRTTGMSMAFHAPNWIQYAPHIRVAAAKETTEQERRHRQQLFVNWILAAIAFFSAAANWVAVLIRC